MSLWRDCLVKRGIEDSNVDGVRKMFAGRPVGGETMRVVKRSEGTKFVDSLLNRSIDNEGGRKSAAMNNTMTDTRDSLSAKRRVKAARTESDIEVTRSIVPSTSN